MPSSNGDVLLFLLPSLWRVVCLYLVPALATLSARNVLLSQSSILLYLQQPLVGPSKEGRTPCASDASPCAKRFVAPDQCVTAPFVLFRFLFLSVSFRANTIPRLGRLLHRINKIHTHTRRRTKFRCTRDESPRARQEPESTKT